MSATGSAKRRPDAEDCAATAATRAFDYKIVVKGTGISPMDEEAFRQFIAERPALNLSALADELGIDRVNLNKSIADLRNILRAKRGQFLATAQKYEYCPTM